jgi:hypothetical protein
LIDRPDALDSHLRRIRRPDPKVIHARGGTVIVYDDDSVQFFLNDPPRPLFTSHNAYNQS